MLNMLQKLLEDETGGSSSSLSEMAALRGLELLELPAEPELQTGWKKIFYVSKIDQSRTLLKYLSPAGKYFANLEDAEADILKDVQQDSTIKAENIIIKEEYVETDSVNTEIKREMELKEEKVSSIQAEKGKKCRALHRLQLRQQWCKPCIKISV